MARREIVMAACWVADPKNVAGRVMPKKNQRDRAGSVIRSAD
jgi:hypothetical protein